MSGFVGSQKFHHWPPRHSYLMPYQLETRAVVPGFRIEVAAKTHLERHMLVAHVDGGNALR